MSLSNERLLENADTKQLIKQAAYEIGVMVVAEKKNDLWAVEFMRKDGSPCLIHVRLDTDYDEILGTLKTHSKSEAKSKAAKEQRIQELKYELALLEADDV